MIKTKKLLSLLLSGAMVFSLFPANVFATEEHIDSTTITEFAELSADVKTQEFTVGETSTPILPDVLSATQTDVTWEEIDGVWLSETTSSNADVAVDWLIEDDKTFSTENAETFTYTASASGYAIASDLEMPQIEVSVQDVPTQFNEPAPISDVIFTVPVDVVNGESTTQTDMRFLVLTEPESDGGNGTAQVGYDGFFNAFDDKSIAGEITIPSTVTNATTNITYNVTEIGDVAFMDCSGLTSIDIPNSVTSIGQSAFLHCSGLTSINIPNGVTSIEAGTFFGCSELKSIDIPNGVTSIGDNAFEGCSGLTFINIPNSVTSISAAAFRNCSSLTEINIPNKVTSISKLAFKYIDALESIYFDGNYPTTDASGISSIRDEAKIYYNSDATGWTSSERIIPVTVTLDDNLVYNGSVQTQGVSSVSVGSVVLDSGDYTISENTATDTGDYTLKVTLTNADYPSFTVTKAFSVVQSETDFNDGIRTFNGYAETTTFTYGDTITARVIPKATGVSSFSLAPPMANQMALYLGDEQISDPVSADSYGVYSMSYDTTGGHLTAGGDWNYITAKYVGNTNMADFSANVAIKLYKANSSVTTAPAAKTLKYTGLPQELVNAGTATNGTMQYSLMEGGEYSPAIPTGTSADTYTVYYKVVGDDNYNDTEVESVTVTIGKATAPNITFPITTDITYGEKLSNSTLSGGSTEFGTFEWTTPDTVPTVTNGGYEVTFTPSQSTIDNYETIAEANTKQNVIVTVAKATPSVNVSLTISRETGNSRAILTATVDKVGNGEIPTGKVTFVNTTSGSDIILESEDMIDGVEAYVWTGLLDQEYTFTATYSGDSNYTTATTGEQSFDTRKQNQTGFTLTDIGAKTYGDSTFTLSSTGGNGTGDVTYTSSDDSIISINGEAATILKAGTVTITATKAEDSTYNAATSEIVLTVAKATITITANNKSAYVNDNSPDLTTPVVGTDYTVSGLVGADNLVGNVTLSYENTPNMDQSGTVKIIASGVTAPNADNYNDIVYVDGTLTISNRPTSGGETNVDIEVKPETNDGNSSADIPDDTLEKAVKDVLDEVKGTNNAPKVTIDVNTPSSADSVEVTLNTSALEDLADNANAVFEIKSGVGTISFDKTALASILSQANGRDITIILREADDLSDKQKSSVQNNTAYELLIEVGSSYITSFDGGIATVSIPYSLKSGENESNIAVYHIDDNGKETYKPTTYNASTKTATFTTEHFSVFAIKSTSNDSPKTGDNSPISLMMFTMILASLGAIILIKKRKNIDKDDLHMA